MRPFDSETLLVVYGPKGTHGEMRFTFTGRPYVINRRTPGIQLHETARNGLTFSYPHTDGEQVAFRGPDGKQYRILILSRHTAGRTWFLKAKQGRKERELIVMGPDYIDNPDDINNMTFEFSDVHQTRDVTVMSGQPWIFNGLSQTKPWDRGTGLTQFRFTGSFAFPSENSEQPMRVLTFHEGTAKRDGAEALPEFDSSAWMSWEGRPRPFEELGITTGHAWYRTTFDLKSTQMPTQTDLNVEHASDFVGIYVNGHYLTTLSPLGTEIFSAHKHPRYQFFGINDWLVLGRNVIAFRVETWGHGSFMFPRGRVTVGNAQIPAVGFDALKGLYGHADLTFSYNNDSTSRPTRLNLSTWQARPLTGGELSGWQKREANTDTWQPITFPLRLNPGENLWVQTRFQTTNLPDIRKFNAPLTLALQGEQIKATLFLNNRLIGRWLSDTDWLRRGSWMESVRDPWMEFSPDHFPFALERLRRDGEANVLTLLLEDTSHNAGATPGVSGHLDQLSIMYNQDRWSNPANRHRIPERAFSFRSIKAPVTAHPEPRLLTWLKSYFANDAR